MLIWLRGLGVCLERFHLAGEGSLWKVFCKEVAVKKQKEQFIDWNADLNWRIQCRNLVVSTNILSRLQHKLTPQCIHKVEQSIYSVEAASIYETIGEKQTRSDLARKIPKRQGRHQGG